LTRGQSMSTCTQRNAKFIFLTRKLSLCRLLMVSKDNKAESVEDFWISGV
jgi:hypothetical protein